MHNIRTVLSWTSLVLHGAMNHFNTCWNKECQTGGQLHSYDAMYSAEYHVFIFKLTLKVLVTTIDALGHF